MPADVAPSGPHPLPFRAGLRVSWVSLLWSAVMAAAAAAFGLAAASPTLLGFGAVGLLDGVGSTGLVMHFRHALRNEAIHEQYERLVFNIVTGGLAVTGLSTIGLSLYGLVHHWTSAATPPGSALSAVSCIVLALLARRKLKVAEAVGSRALRSDGWVSATGATLSAVALAGTSFYAVSGLGWIDPAAAIVVAVGALWLSATLAAKG